MFHVGQEIICINDDPPPADCGYGDEIMPVRYQLYHARWVSGCGVAVLLCEIINKRRPYTDQVTHVVETWEYRFLSERFRPIDKRDISIFTAMTKGTDHERPIDVVPVRDDQHAHVDRT